MSASNRYPHITYAPLMNRFRGQLMTIIPFFLGPFTQKFPKNRTRYTYVVEDRSRDELTIIGDLYSASKEERATELRIILHGISSTPRSPYLAPYVKEGVSSGVDVLSLSLRGALGIGRDHYHAGLTEDIHSLLKDPCLSHYTSISLLGCSLGGLVVLNFARERRDSRVKKVVSICPPLQLNTVQSHLDKPSQVIYRKVVLTSLKYSYLKLWKNAKKANQPLKSDIKTVLKASTFAEWDKAVVVPRFSFGSIEDYHRKVSIRSEDLKHLEIPSLVVLDHADPLVPFEEQGVREGMKLNRCEIKVTTGGGHIGFPRHLNLGFGERTGIAPQVSRWLELMN